MVNVGTFELKKTRVYHFCLSHVLLGSMVINPSSKGAWHLPEPWFRGRISSSTFTSWEVSFKWERKDPYPVGEGWGAFILVRTCSSYTEFLRRFEVIGSSFPMGY